MEVNDEVKLLQLAMMSRALSISPADGSSSDYFSSRTSDLTFPLILEAILREMEQQENSAITAGAAGDERGTWNSEILGVLRANLARYLDTTELHILTSQLDIPKAYNGQSDAAPQAQRQMIEDAVEKASAKYGVDKKLIMAVIRQESGFNPYAVSPAGAMGLMQLMPGTAAGLGVTDPFDIYQNVDGGTRYLRQQLDRYGGSVEMALMAYNAGPGTVQNRGVRGPEDLAKMPAETRHYVQKVMEYYHSA